MRSKQNDLLAQGNFLNWSKVKVDDDLVQGLFQYNVWTVNLLGAVGTINLWTINLLWPGSWRSWGVLG